MDLSNGICGIVIYPQQPAKDVIVRWNPQDSPNIRQCNANCGTISPVALVLRIVDGDFPFGRYWQVSKDSLCKMYTADMWVKFRKTTINQVQVINIQFYSAPDCDPNSVLEDRDAHNHEGIPMSSIGIAEILPSWSGNIDNLELYVP